MAKQRAEIASWGIVAAIGIVLLVVDKTLKIATTYLTLAIFAAMIRLLILLLVQSVRVAKEWERFVILRVGRYIGTKGPGVILVIPFLDSCQVIDMRVRFQEVPHESCITKDNARIDVDFLFYWRVKDPELAVLKIRGLEDSLTGLATGLLRAVIGDISLDAALAEREHINLQLREKIDEVTEQWGIEVSTVEIREIIMPAAVQEIMSRQMAAERTKRATILEAEGYKEAQTLKAQGDANALQLLSHAARNVNQNTMNLKYFDMLRALGEGQATKYIFPLEFNAMVRSITAALETHGADATPPTSELSTKNDSAAGIAPSSPNEGSDVAPGTAT